MPAPTSVGPSGGGLSAPTDPPTTRATATSPGTPPFNDQQSSTPQPTQAASGPLPPPFQPAATYQQAPPQQAFAQPAQPQQFYVAAPQANSGAGGQPPQIILQAAPGHAGAIRMVQMPTAHMAMPAHLAAPQQMTAQQLGGKVILAANGNGDASKTDRQPITAAGPPMMLVQQLPPGGVQTTHAMPHGTIWQPAAQYPQHASQRDSTQTISTQAQLVSAVGQAIADAAKNRASHYDEA